MIFISPYFIVTPNNKSASADAYDTADNHVSYVVNHLFLVDQVNSNVVASKMANANIKR